MAGIIGAVAGYLIGGLWWALAGYFIGRLFGRGLAQSVRRSFATQPEDAERFFYTVFSLLGALAKADGRVSENEIAHAEALMARLGIRGNRRDAAIASFKQGSNADFALEQTLQEFASSSRFRPDLKRNLLVFLVEMAMADADLHEAEEQLLRRVAAGLHIDPRSFEQLLAMLKAQHSFAGSQQRATHASDLANAYQALGVSAAATDKEVKRAYRKLMSQYHPDKMIAKGVPEDMLAMATEKAQEIQAAYDVIEKSRKR
ncbi:MAG: co-chaperone DjlA [Pseudomonadales bacterium]|nr:co-chaperone DjlA [Pseudomonadales bacterium]